MVNDLNVQRNQLQGSNFASNVRPSLILPGLCRSQSGRSQRIHANSSYIFFYQKLPVLVKRANVWKWCRTFNAKIFVLNVRHLTSPRSFRVEHSGQLPKVARQRALPQAESLPAPHRRFDHVCAKGHQGRKRGEVVRTTCTAGPLRWCWRTETPNKMPTTRSLTRPGDRNASRSWLSGWGTSDWNEAAHLAPAGVRTTECAPAHAVSPAAPSEPATPVIYGPPQWAKRSFTGGFPGSAFPLQPDGTLRCPADRPLYAQERRSSTRWLSARVVRGSHWLLPRLSLARAVSGTSLHQKTAPGQCRLQAFAR